MKKLVIFDLDGTLTKSKLAIDSEMLLLLTELLARVPVAIISGGDWPQFQNQLLSHFSPNQNLKDLFILPTCGTKFYREGDTGWQKLYSENFSKEQKEKIIASLNQVIKSLDFKPTTVWGEMIEDRGSQLTFSALGQQAPIQTKRQWDPDFSKRIQMKALLDDLIPEFSVRFGGTTSIDITKASIDKAYGIGKLRDLFDFAIKDMVFIGDALFAGGNDYPVKEAGVCSIQIKDPEETKRVIETIICLCPVLV